MAALRIVAEGTAIVIFIASLGACSAAQAAGESSAPTEANGINLTAELNEATGSVILPFDRLSLTAEELDLLSTAGSVVVSRCALEHGVNFSPPDLTYDPVYDSEDYFGPWTIEQARKFAFVMPMTDADLAANGLIDSEGRIPQDQVISANAGLTDADWKVVDDCGRVPDLKEFTDALARVGPWTDAIDAVHESLLEDERASAILGDLTSCYEATGFRGADGEPWLPEGADGRTISEEQVQLALAVVDCKSQVNFTRRMADLEASLQAPIIAEYSKELSARRAMMDTAVADARDLIAGRGASTASGA